MAPYAIAQQCLPWYSGYPCIYNTMVGAPTPLYGNPGINFDSPQNLVVPPCLWRIGSRNPMDTQICGCLSPLHKNDIE